MTTTDKTTRWKNVFSHDGNSLIVAIDHSMYGIGPIDGLVHPETVIDQVKQGGANAILCTPGVAGKFRRCLDGLGLILRIDGGATTLGSGIKNLGLISSVEDAVRLGADGVVVMCFIGTDDERSSLKTLGQIAVQCRQYEMPLMAEMLPMGYEAHPTLDQLIIAARIGAELGADIIKIRFSGTAQEYSRVVEKCFVPLVILGGAAKEYQGMLHEIREAMKSGARGVAIGRNIWQHENPTGLTRAIHEIVHPRFQDL